MPLKQILIVGLFLTILLTMPAMAQLNITHLDDGKTLFANGSYWILWDSIGNHTVGDQFFVNATTNLPAGTEVITRFYDTSRYCRTKICNLETSATGAHIILGPGNPSGINHISVFINTTGFYAADGYFFDFDIISSKNADEDSALSGGQVKGLIVLYPVSNVNSFLPHNYLILPAVFCFSILILVIIFRLRQKKT